jgi:hypothetical protein
MVILGAALHAESLRVLVKDRLEVGAETPAGASVPMLAGDSVLVFLGPDTRFVRALEFELSAPQEWLPFPESLAVGLYSHMSAVPENGPAEIEALPLYFGPLPSKIHSVYVLPIRERHGLRDTPFAVLADTVLPEGFPLLLRLSPIAKTDGGLSAIRFQLNVKPVFSDEGALVINIHRPEARPNGSYIVLLDEQALEDPAAERIVREGEHNLTVVSNDYRGENRRLVVERGKTNIVSVTLRDITPLIIFEAPLEARLFVDGEPAARTSAPLAVAPGPHEIRALISDYTLVKNVLIEKGKTYRVVFTIDLLIQED